MERSISPSLPFLQEMTFHHQNLTILTYLETATMQVCPIARSRPTNVTGAHSREGVRPHSSTTRDLRLIRVFIGHRNLFCNIFVNFWKLPLKFERSLDRGGWASEWRSHEPLPRQFHRMLETSESSFWKWQLCLHCPAKWFEVGRWLFCVHANASESWKLFLPAAGVRSSLIVDSSGTRECERIHQSRQEWFAEVLARKRIVNYRVQAVWSAKEHYG